MTDQSNTPEGQEAHNEEFRAIVERYIDAENDDYTLSDALRDAYAIGRSALQQENERLKSGLWPLLNEIERAAWSRSFKRLQVARAALAEAIGIPRPLPSVELESASQFRRVTVMEAGRAERDALRDAAAERT